MASLLGIIALLHDPVWAKLELLDTRPHIWRYNTYYCIADCKKLKSCSCKTTQIITPPPSCFTVNMRCLCRGLVFGWTSPLWFYLSERHCSTSRGLFRCSFVVLRENKQTAKSSALMVTLIIKQVEWLSAPGCSNKGLYFFSPWLCMTNTKYFFVLFKTHILTFTINQSVFDILTLTTDCLFGRLLDPLFPAVYTEPCNGSLALLLSQYI